MRRAVLALTIAATGLLAGSATGRSHRHRCDRHHHHHCLKHRAKPPVTTTTTTTTPAPLPRRLGVDENDTPTYSLSPSRNPVAAGSVEFNVTNYGQDTHTFAITDATGRRITFADGAVLLALTPAASGTVTATLPAGTYTLFCTLRGHAAAGMRATLTTR